MSAAFSWTASLSGNEFVISFSIETKGRQTGFASTMVNQWLPFITTSLEKFLSAFQLIKDVNLLAESCSGGPDQSSRKLSSLILDGVGGMDTRDPRDP